MKPLNLLHKHRNQRLKLLPNNKIQFISFLKQNKNSLNLLNPNSINKSNYNFNKKNNITINNSINHITNNITINNNSINNSKNFYRTNNNSISKPKETNFQNYKSYMDKKNVKIEISLKKPLNFSRNGHNSFTFNTNKSLYYLSVNNKMKKNPSFQNNNNIIKNKHAKYKLKLLYKIPNNKNLNLQNISNYICNRNKINNNSIYNLTNNSINENNKRAKNNSKNSTTNNSTNKVNSFFNRKSELYLKESNDKKISIRINKNINKFNNLNNKINNNNNKLYDEYILQRIIHKKNKNTSNNIKKFRLRGNANSISNNTNNIYSDTNSNIQISKYVNNFLYKSKQLNINNNNQESSKNRVYSSNYDIDDNDNDNKNEFQKETKNEKNKEQEREDSSLDDTIKFSKCSSKVEEEGELGLDEVKDIIVYFNLNDGVENKNYLFKKNDYNDFLEKKKYKYLKFFLK